MHLVLGLYDQWKCKEKINLKCEESCRGGKVRVMKYSELVFAKTSHPKVESAATTSQRLTFQ